MDNINGVFELVGGVFVFLNVLRLYKDKKVRGASTLATLFFTVWGYWNLIYYPSLEQWTSALGAASVALMNTVWLVQMIYYSKKEAD